MIAPRRLLLRFVLVLSAVSAAASSAPAGASVPDADFAAFVAGLRTEALARGISQATVDVVLGDLQPIARVVELDRSQPKSPAEFCSYFERRLTPTRIERGRALLAENEALLAEIADAYGVPARYLVALWGLETNFGDYLGDYPVPGALATLAHDGRRGAFFRRELLAALQIVDEGHRPAEGFVGSWAGATGQVQFMPSTFLAYAVDHDGDGRKDLWENVSDALASAANYLRRAGWQATQNWGRQVRVPASLRDRAGLTHSRTVDQWQALGLRLANGSHLPSANLPGTVVLPGKGFDPAFLVYRNYRSFLAWNNSSFFALSVGALADALDGRPPSACGELSDPPRAGAPGP